MLNVKEYKDSSGNYSALGFSKIYSVQLQPGVDTIGSF